MSEAVYEDFLGSLSGVISSLHFTLFEYKINPSGRPGKPQKVAHFLTNLGVEFFLQSGFDGGLESAYLFVGQCMLIGTEDDMERHTLAVLRRVAFGFDFFF